MKTAIYIEGGLIQLVLTPENDFEKATIGMFQEQQRAVGDVGIGTVLNAEMFRGTFYDCRGGWTRQSDYLPHAIYPEKSDHSLIIRVKPKREKANA